MERVQKSVAHLNLIMEDQLFIKGVPHLNEHALKMCLLPYFFQRAGGHNFNKFTE